MLRDEAGSSYDVAARMPADEDAPLALAKEVEMLFDQWRTPLLRYVITLGLPVEQGEEVVQEVFLSLFQHLRCRKPRANLRGWLFRVGHNLALKRRYASGRELQMPAAGVLEDIADDAPDPEHSCAIKQRQARLIAAVTALPEQDRCCLHLRAEGLRYRDIAAVLGISLGSVALSLGRSLQRLRHAGG
jgi:RNA polymerase sigma-70 factor (ECF subfamily)